MLFCATEATSWFFTQKPSQMVPATEEQSQCGPTGSDKQAKGVCCASRRSDFSREKTAELNSKSGDFIYFSSHRIQRKQQNIQTLTDERVVGFALFTGSVHNKQIYLLHFHFSI